MQSPSTVSRETSYRVWQQPRAVLSAEHNCPPPAVPRSPVSSEVMAVLVDTLAPQKLIVSDGLQTEIHLLMREFSQYGWKTDTVWELRRDKQDPRETLAERDDDNGSTLTNGSNTRTKSRSNKRKQDTGKQTSDRVSDQPNSARFRRHKPELTVTTTVSSPSRLDMRQLAKYCEALQNDEQHTPLESSTDKTNKCSVSGVFCKN